MNRLLFHPKITAGALIAGLTALVGFGPTIASTFGPKGVVVEVAAAVLLAICTFGRSPAPSVDNAKQ